MINPKIFENNLNNVHKKCITKLNIATLPETAAQRY